MAQPDSATKLRRALRTVNESIRASEAWHPAYQKDDETFKALLTLESGLQLNVADYLKEFSERAPAYVDWAQYSIQVAADASPLLNKDDNVWASERLDLQRAIIDAITSIVALGGNAAEKLYGIDLGITPLDGSVLEAARKQVAKLVTKVTDTSRDLIRSAIKQSIARGEDNAAAIERIKTVINNPVRAELIAQTESVNAYQTGMFNFATETNAKTKTWQAIPGACEICSPLDDETVDIDSPFEPGDVDIPTAHPRCRCNVRYNYK